MRYDLNTGVSTEVYYEADEIFSVYVSKSQNDKFIFINTASFDSAEVRYIPSEQPLTEMKMFLGREPKHEYSLEDGDDGFYVLTNWGAENFRIMKAPHDRLNKENWAEVVPHRQEIFVSHILILKSHFVLAERSQGLTQIEVVDRKSLNSTMVKFPDASYVVGLGTNLDYDIGYARLNYQSMVRPGSVYDFDFASGSLKLIKQNEVPTYDAAQYESERVWATASDGTKIPVSLVYRKDLRANGKNPILIYGYGSYGLSVDPGFRISIFSLLDRGFIYAMAHIRGGSEMGRSWYEQGRMDHKKNSFTDFIAVTEFLVENGYADRTKVFASGGSAGGLLMGAISNLRPDLYRGIVSIVPFVDVVTTMLDADIPLTTAEYEQWGNPNEKGAYSYIKSYSPYDNIERKAYPAMLVMTGYHDSQVQYWEPAKYVAKLRDNTTSEQPVLFRIDMEAGHSGASGRFAPLKETAYQWAFLIQLADADK
jgi:oligopeptidase B